MSGSPWKRIASVLVVLSLGLVGLVVLIPGATAATWTQTTDGDFNAGTLSGVEVVGTGAPAYVQLLKDATDWRNELPPSNPSAREGPAMAYDAANGVVVLFGGYGTGGNFGDTWEYNVAANTWAQTSSTGPSARAYAGMAYDSNVQRIVLFGGVSDLGFEADTWEYNAATDTWVQTTPVPSPPTMASYAMAYHTQVQRSILVGMSLSSGLLETWAYNAATDTWANRAPSSMPSARSNHGVAYHESLNRIVLYGGAFLTTLYGDTHEYNYATNAWTLTVPGGSGPPARASHGMAYRGSVASVYLFGGTTGSPQADTWRYFDAAGTRTWVNVPTQRNPSARSVFGFTDEASNGKSVLFGGLLAGGSRASDTWSFGPAFRSTGFLTSSVFDSGASDVNWDTLSWMPTSQPGGTTLRFQMAASNSPTGPWTFRGPDCQTITYYVTSGTAICSQQDGLRYIRYQAQLLTSNNLFTPTMDEVTVVYDVPPASPRIILTDPADGDLGVARTKAIFIRFSEPMDTASVTYTINPSISVTPTWSEGDSALTLDHATLFQECKAYTVTVTAGKDKAGNNLVPGPVPNPWGFATECVNPTITSTSPPQGQVDVPLNAAIIVNFSEPMNTTTVQWTINPTITLSPAWSNGDQTLTLTHATDFPQCTLHTVQITGKDTAGLSLVPGAVPNPWSFTTLCTVPFIVSTSPSHLEINVAVTRNIVVQFSEPMLPSSLTYSISPSITLTPAWSNGDRTLNFSHAAPFSVCTSYTVQVGATDVDGNPLIPGPVPNPWTFSTTCPNPFIVVTVPANGATGVDALADIFVIFSEPMNTGSVTWTITGGIPLTPSWSPMNDVLTLSHTTPFVCGPNTVQISGNDLSGNPLVPGPAPNPWTFSPLCPNPFIVSTSPANDATGVALDASIVITFNEAMSPPTVTWGIVPSVSLMFAWSAGDTVLTLTHAAPFSQSTQYTVAILTGQDVDGNDLVEGPVPNPWRFTTVGVNPRILSTVPANGATGVSVVAEITVTFSEAMNETTVVATPSPAISLTYRWSSNSTVLTLGHTTPFAECTTYTITVTGNDTQGDSLIAGPVPNPWSFTVECFAPYITSTSPADGATGVALNAPIIVQFSEPMNTTSVVVNINPSIALTPAWSNGNRTLTLTHAAPFLECTTYTVTVSGRDLDGNALVPGPVPNPWSFDTVCVAPFITSTSPADGATGVPLGAPIIVNFSEPMNTGTVTWSTNPGIALTPAWSNGNRTLTLTHAAPFLECTTYTVTVSGRDLDGNALVAGPVPNPWAFDTVCVAPYITSTSPADGATGVPLLAPIIIDFSEPMDPGTVTWSTNPGIALTPAWSNGNRTLTLTHAAPFLECTTYTVTVFGRDLDGNALVPGPVPNPWSFQTVCPAPFIVSTVPAQGATNVPATSTVVVTFSRAMDTATVTWTFTPGVTATPAWTVGDTVLTLTPSPALLECTPYQVLIQGNDTNGNALVAGPVPNPWSFDTACPIGPPTGLQILRVPPTTIRLTWNAVVNADAYRVYESQDRFAPFPWTVLGETTATTFDAVGHLTDGLTHYYIVRTLRSTAESANSTMAVKIDMPVRFNPTGTNVRWFSLPYNSPYARASDIAAELTSARVGVIAKWNPATQSSILYYYFRGSWRGTNFAINPGDGLWIGSVSAFDWVIAGTDRAVTLSFTVNPPPVQNVNWMSLPYASTYTKASDLVLDIEGSLGPGARTKIVEVAKWDPTTQSLVRYMWSPAGWGGTDFALNPGDGLYLRIVSSFTWQPKLVTPEVP